LPQRNEEIDPNIRGFFQELVTFWISQISGDQSNDDTHSSILLHGSEIAKLWGALVCYPHVFSSLSNISLVMDLVNVIDHLLVAEADRIAGQMRFT
jgi:hypothetical protein